MLNPNLTLFFHYSVLFLPRGQFCKFRILTPTIFGPLSKIIIAMVIFLKFRLQMQNTSNIPDTYFKIFQSCRFLIIQFNIQKLQTFFSLKNQHFKQLTTYKLRKTLNNHIY